MLCLGLIQSAAASFLPEQIDALTESKLLEQRQTVDQEHLYPAGSIRRISGNLRYSSEFRGLGEQQLQTWQISPLYSADQAFAEVRQFWREQGAHTLYWCEGRECGPSSLWANSVFKSARLYGPEDNQAYALMMPPQTEARATSQVIALYAIKRGNGRMYLHQETLQLQQVLTQPLPEPATLLKQLDKEGELALRHLTEGPTEDWVNLLARTIKRNTLLQVELQGNQAEQWQAALIKQGVRAQQLRATADSQAAGLLLKKH